MKSQNVLKIQDYELYGMIRGPRQYDCIDEFLWSNLWSAVFSSQTSNLIAINPYRNNPLGNKTFSDLKDDYYKIN